MTLQKSDLLDGFPAVVEEETYFRSTQSSLSRASTEGRSALEISKSREAEALKRLRERPVQLPLWLDWEWAMPTILTRSALFAPICQGHREWHNETIIESRSDAVLNYTGWQLDMSDADLFMVSLSLAKRHPLGFRFPVNRAHLLTAMGRAYERRLKSGRVCRSGIGEKQYAWLNAAMERLRLASLKFEIRETEKRKGRGGRFNLIHTWLWDDNENSYVLAIEPEIEKIFANFSRIYIETHLSLPKTDQLAKWLHLYISGCTKRSLTRIGLEHLKMWSGNGHRRTDHFAAAVRRALTNLEEKKVISPGWFIRPGDYMVCFTRII
jgi:hypothetical protein